MGFGAVFYSVEVPGEPVVGVVGDKMVITIFSIFVLDMITDAGDAPYRQSDTSPVLERLWLEKV